MPFKPKFTLNNVLFNNLTRIERLYGQLEGETLIPSLALALKQRNLILATHFSTSIEGNPLNEMEVTNIILGDKVPKTKPEIEVRNYFDALTSLDNTARGNGEITSSLILNLHAKLMTKIKIKAPGEFRDGRVVVGHYSDAQDQISIEVKHDPPSHKRQEITKLVEDLLSWIKTDSQTHPVFKAGILHHQFAYIHPFYDGNGRMARLLTVLFLIINGYDVSRYFVLDDYYDVDRLLYSDKLHSADTGDKTEWLEYFSEGLIYSLQSALGNIKDLQRKKMEEIEGEKRVMVTKREEDVLRIVIEKGKVKTADIVNSLQVTRQQAHALLDSLVKKNLLAKQGITKSSYYELKGEQYQR